VRIVFKVITVLTIGMATSVGAQNGGPQIRLVREPCDTTVGMRVFVEADGVVLLNTKKVDLDDLPAQLEKLAGDVQLICYSRANPDEEPHPNASAAIQAIAALKLPIAFYWDREFQMLVRFK